LERLRVLLAEDHAVVREGTREMLERDPGISVVGEAGGTWVPLRSLATALQGDVPNVASLRGRSALGLRRRTRHVLAMAALAVRRPSIDRSPISTTSASRPSASAIVLAGGHSTRFGANKLEVYVGGRPLLGYALAAAASACQEVLVVTAPSGAVLDRSLLAAARGTRVRVVPDEQEFGGPLLGVLAGLRAARNPFCLVVGGDMPLLRRELLAHLLATARDERATRPRSVGLRLDGAVQPLPIVVRRDAAPVVVRLVRGGRRALRDLFDAVPFQVLEPAEWLPYDPEGTSLVDIDRIDDLVRWSARLTPDKHQPDG